jgi:peptidoglycan/LPS O-acetylase OafA/YrhL
MWSLVHEMRISIFMPLIFLAVRRVGSIPVLAGCTLASVLASIASDDIGLGSWQMTLHVLWMFSAGITLAFHRMAIAVQLTKCPRHFFILLVLVAIGLLAVPFHRSWGDFVIGMGAALLIALCLPATHLSRALTVPPLLWLGRISYSLYLVHFPILLFGITGGFFSHPTVVLLVLIFLAADLTFRIVEAPAQRLGAELAGRAQPTVALPPTSAVGNFPEK